MSSDTNVGIAVLKGPLSPGDIELWMSKNGDRPVVFTNLIESWPARQWDLNTFSEGALGDLKTSVRFHLKEDNERGCVWETAGQTYEASLRDFSSWMSDGESGQPSARPFPFNMFPPKSYWGYVDYKRFPELFRSHSELVEAVDWGVLGQENVAENMAFWMGSEGAVTQCHLDSYGANFVGQIFGKKRWRLISPDESKSMEATRVPYEESSVFSRVDLHNRNMEGRCYDITLEPGMVLYVPKHWWHSVYSVSNSISVNMWIPRKDDCVDRMKEAIVRTVVAGVMPKSKPECSKCSSSWIPEAVKMGWLCPSEATGLFDARQNGEFILEAMQECLQKDDAHDHGSSSVRSRHVHEGSEDGPTWNDVLIETVNVISSEPVLSTIVSALHARFGSRLKEKSRKRKFEDNSGAT